MEKSKVNLTVPYSKGKIAKRLQDAVKLGGGNSVVVAKSGIPSRTLGNYLSGRSEPKIGTLVRLSEACEISLNWLASGRLPVHTVERLAKFEKDVGEVTGGRVDEKLLSEIIQLVEQWLDGHGRALLPDKKGDVVATLYEIAIEDFEATGKAHVEPKKVERILRLVA